MKEKKLAIKYYVDDIKASYIPNTSISKVLSGIEMSKISKMSLKFLDTNKLVSLKSLVSHEITFEEYIPLAKNEQEMRIQDSKRKEIEEENKKQQKQQIQNKIDYKRKLERREEKERQKANSYYIEKQNKLRETYSLTFYIKKNDYNKLMKIVEMIDNRNRIEDADFVWLKDSENYFTNEIKRAYYSIEASHYKKEYEDKKNSWDAVQASANYRKAEMPRNAISVVSKITLENINDNKLKSAICTTYGGAKRDMQEWEDAIGLAESAHKYQSDDYRPCTLLGAIFMETGNYELGDEWYEKAIKRGFDRESRDSEIKSIYLKSDKKNKEKLREYLLKQDQYSYHWLK